MSRDGRVPLRFVAHRTRGWIGWLIRWQTDAGPDGPSHISYLDDAGYLVEAREWRGVVRERTLDAARASGDRVQILTVWVAPDAAARADAYALRGVSEAWGYDYLAIVRFLTRGRRQSGARKFCSEFADEIASAAGVTVTAEPPWRVSPAEFCHSPIWERS